MLHSHDKCPICGLGLKHIPKIMIAAPIIHQNKSGSYIESICNKDMTFHLFFQLSSKEGERLVEKITFPQEGKEIEVNYTLNKTSMIYQSKTRFDSQQKKWDHRPPTILELKDRILDLDYPGLEKITKKIKSLAAFL